jgi:hypothetical protein
MDTHHKYEFNWLMPGKNNPYAKKMLDIRSLTQQNSIFTHSKRVQKKFTELRTMDAGHFKTTRFEHSKVLDCHIAYPTALNHEGVLYRANTLNDKWDIFLKDDQVYFSRSLSGELVFRSHVSKMNNKFIVDSIEYAQGDIFYDEPELAISYVHFLLLSHVMNIILPHTIPMILNDLDTMGIALFSYNQFGRKCWFASKENILDLNKHNLAGNEDCGVEADKS